MEELREALNAISVTRSGYSDAWKIPGSPKSLVIESNKHLVRGAAGGNCWGGEAESFNIGELPAESLDFSELQAILGEHKPDFTLKQWRALISKAESITVYNREYYGNYEEFQIGILRIEDIMNA